MHPPQCSNSSSNDTKPLLGKRLLKNKIAYGLKASSYKLLAKYKRSRLYNLAINTLTK